MYKYIYVFQIHVYIYIYIYIYVFLAQYFGGLMNYPRTFVVAVFFLYIIF